MQLDHGMILISSYLKANLIVLKWSVDTGLRVHHMDCSDWWMQAQVSMWYRWKYWGEWVSINCAESVNRIHSGDVFVCSCVWYNDKLKPCHEVHTSANQIVTLRNRIVSVLIYFAHLPFCGGTVPSCSHSRSSGRRWVCALWGFKDDSDGTA